MGRKYAATRNFDFGPADRSNVSGLSAHVRHRLITEQELVETALTHHGLEAAEKFIQEACWRTYWKGWLEQRPSVWTAFRTELLQDLKSLDRDGDLRSRYEAAVSGSTGISCFDAWSRELVEHGYLHNHARMWFASIWVYTLDLPWRLGADFFLRNLMDGDAASNTLGWRWVCGLQTAGKTYLARASNINKFTNGRFEMQGYQLASDAPPLDPELIHPDPAPLRPGDLPDRAAPTLLLVHDEDCLPEQWGLEGLDVRGVAASGGVHLRSPLPVGERASAFTAAALDDALERARHAFDAPCSRITLEGLADAARSVGATQVITQRPHIGPLHDQLASQTGALASAGIRLTALRRDWDRAFHPHADRGFFKVKKKIPDVLHQLGLV